ncbi:MAG: PrpF domain-containing protein, partial [Pseudomonadota bacterium]|nr:PrpF domain-containing protein [Pseudomonadota bacterium]
QLAGRTSSQLRLGHTSGTLAVGAEAKQSDDNHWQINRATMQRSARVLMEGWVRVPGDFR